MKDLRILIFERHASVRESLKFVFAAEGVQRIALAATRQEATQAVRRDVFDVVLLDLDVGEHDEFATLREIKAIDAKVAVVVHSLREHWRFLARAEELGAAGYVVKGHDKNILLRAVRRTTKATASTK